MSIHRKILLNIELYCIHVGKEKLGFQADKKVKVYTEDDGTEVEDTFSEFGSSTIFIIDDEEECSPTAADDIKDTECHFPLFNGMYIKC